MTAIVPAIDTGIVKAGITVIQKRLRNINRTSTTSTIDTPIVDRTSAIAARISNVRSYKTCILIPAGIQRSNCGSNLTVASTVSTTFASAVLRTYRTTAESLSNQPAASSLIVLSNTSATSR